MSERFGSLLGRMRRLSLLNAKFIPLSARNVIYVAVHTFFFPASPNPRESIAGTEAAGAPSERSVFVRVLKSCCTSPGYRGVYRCGNVSLPAGRCLDATAPPTGSRESRPSPHRRMRIFLIAIYTPSVYLARQK